MDTYSKPMMRNSRAITNPQEISFTLSNNEEIILNLSMTVHFYLNVKHLSMLKNPQILMCS